MNDLWRANGEFLVSDSRIHTEIKYIYRELVDLTGEESNLLFQVLQDWERHLAQLDLKGLEVRNDKPKP